MSSPGGLRVGMVPVLLALTVTTACSPATQSVSTQPTPNLSVVTSSPSEAASPAQSPTPTSKPKPTSTPSATRSPTTGIVKNGDGWSTYTNAEVGFTLRFPTHVYAYNGAPCAKRQESGDWTYRAVPGVVPATVTQDGSTLWVVQKISYQLGKAKDLANGATLYRSCTKRTTTVAMMRAAEAPGFVYFLNYLPITVAPAHNRTEVQDELLAYFTNCPQIKLLSLNPSTSGSWRDVAVACPNNPAFPGGVTEIRWYQAQGLFVVFDFGQVEHIFTAKNKSVDLKVAASFKVLP
jgi:hypothetical protein